MQQQQRPRDRIAQLQQMSGSSDFQQQGGRDRPQQMGEGGTPDAQQRLGGSSERADDREDARGSRPGAGLEAREADRAVRDGRSRAGSDS